MFVAVGMKGHAKMEVTWQNTAAAINSDLLPVFGSPYMIALIENASINAVQDVLVAGQGTVGTKFSMSHEAATPIGASVWAEAEVTSVEGKKIGLFVIAYDDFGIIGKGVHERYIIESDSFLAKVNAKSKGAHQ